MSTDNRRGRAGGRGRGNRRRGGGRQSNNKNEGTVTTGTKMKDEDVMVAFAPFMREDNQEAVAIHEKYQSDNNHNAFILAASNFLQRQKNGKTASPPPAKSAAAPSSPEPEPQSTPVAKPAVAGLQLDKMSLNQDPFFDPQASPLPYPIGGSAVRPSPQGMVGAHCSHMPPLSPSAGLLSPQQQPTVMASPPVAAQQPIASPSQPKSPIPIGQQQQQLPPGMPLGLNSPVTMNAQLSPQPSTLTPIAVSDGRVKVAAPAETVSDGRVKVAAPAETATTPAKRPAYQPKRVWTNVEQQPGRVFVNDLTVPHSIKLRPRQQITAKWTLPLEYLQHRAQKGDKNPQKMSLRDALFALQVGLFRVGCMENGTNASIISKEILSNDRSDYPFEIDQRTGTVWGNVPFYAPRTPGNVVFRLYWQDEPLYTLGSGPTLRVLVTEPDFEPTLRFILSNFKSRKGNPTSLSSLGSLTCVLEQFHPISDGGHQKWDGAGRAAWGCICESRKVLEACAAEYKKTREKFNKLEQEIAQEQKDLDRKGPASEKGSEGESDEEDPAAVKLKAKIARGGRAASERRWHDSQVTFAGVLYSVLSNPRASLLFRRELLSKLRLEYALWCPLCESFAPSPWNRNSSALCVDFGSLPQHVTEHEFGRCTKSLNAMQQESLGFVPNQKSLEQVIMAATKPPSMDKMAVETFNQLSASMGQLYQDVYMVTDRNHQQREMVRSHIESIVSKCDAFPPGTRVVVFGSSANGFGSPTSDLDMCLQLPPNTSIVKDEDDSTGAGAMEKLGKLFEAAGLQSVDTARLTARIPVIMFNCPRPLAEQGEDPLMECDLSMQNPLACLNTSLLLTYSRIHPVTRVLSSIIKRWAKARNINNPSQHTLSSYGYILMLLHFMTYHRRTGTGLVAKLDRNGANSPATSTPLLPNLMWMEMNWPKTAPLSTPYQELNVMPQNVIPHPLEKDAQVNTYFYRLSDQNTLLELQRHFPSQDLSLAILLASFFRYYAFEFDYKKNVVSLHSTLTRGLVEREVKAEVCAWRVYSTGLAIEDPFETFYDVAHVLKGGNFHKLRNEFALAYTKIINAASGKGKKMTGMELIDWLCEVVETEVTAHP